MGSQLINWFRLSKWPSSLANTPTGSRSAIVKNLARAYPTAGIFFLTTWLPICPLISYFILPQIPFAIVKMSQSKKQHLMNASKGDTSILAPDYSSLSNFPRRAFKRASTIARKRPHMVRFISSANEEFIIQSRRSQEHSVSEEELMNRIYRIRLEIDNTLAEMELLDEKEINLQDEVDELRPRAGDGGIMKAKRVISALESKSNRLDRETLNMKMTVLRLKGKNEQLQKDQLDVKKAKSFYRMAKALWEHAILNADEAPPIKSKKAITTAARSAWHPEPEIGKCKPY